jgi:hypothetical protein
MYAEDHYESVAIGKETLKNVRVFPSPVDLLLIYDGGNRRIALQQLPESLKAKYPYDEKKAQEYARQQKEEARKLQASNIAAMKASLLIKKDGIQKKLEKAEAEFNRVSEDLVSRFNISKGKPNGSPEKEMVNVLRKKKMEVRDEVRKLGDELKKVEDDLVRYTPK